MNYIHVTSATTEYPYSLWDLRKDHPNVSFPESPSDDDLAAFGVFPVASTPPPTCDPRTERPVESAPVYHESGQWRQSWTVRLATAEEIEAYDVANAPTPQWMQFGIAMATMPEVSQLFELLPSAISSALSVGLSEAAKGDARLFLGLWQQISVHVDKELRSAIIGTATECCLPAEFVAGLAGESA